MSSEMMSALLQIQRDGGYIFYGIIEDSGMAGALLGISTIYLAYSTYEVRIHLIRLANIIWIIIRIHENWHSGRML